METYTYIENSDLFDILRAFQAGTWLTVHCLLDMLKLLGNPRGGLGQRLSVRWALGGRSKWKIGRKSDDAMPERFIQVVLCIVLLLLS